MRIVFRLFLVFVGLIFIGISLVKFVQNCSWKEAVGIAEELLKEI